MTMSISDLFTPAVSGVTTDPNATPADGSWLAQILANATTLQLQTTAWQPGGVERTINAIMAVLFSQSDVIVSTMAQGGFLDFAASGTVSYVALNGETVTAYVSPDPSIPEQNPDGKTTWLDILADSVYAVTRTPARAASGTMVFANTQGTPYGPYDVGTFHVANPTTNASYSNSASLTIAAQTLVGTKIDDATNASPITITTHTAHGLSTGQYVQIADVAGNTAANGVWEITVLSTTTFQLLGSTGNDSWMTSTGTVNVCTSGTFAADVAGTSGTSAARAITELVNSLTGVACTNLTAFFGVNWESNTALADRCRLRLQSLSPNGPHGAYEYFAKSAIDLLAAETPPVILSDAINRVLVQSSIINGTVTTTIANENGNVSGVTNLQVSDATATSPIEIQTASNHGLLTGDFVTISGVLGNTAANGTWAITVTGLDTFTLDGSTYSGTFSGGGVVEGGDLGQVDKIIQANCVPDDTTAITQSAVAFNVAVVATVTLPQAYATQYATAIQVAFASYFKGLPIGGSGGVVEYDNIIGILYATAAGLGVSPGQMTSSGVTLNGGTSNLSYPGATYVAVLSPAPAITVVGT